jgi:hypothetical protein
LLRPEQSYFTQQQQYAQQEVLPRVRWWFLQLCRYKEKTKFEHAKAK